MILPLLILIICKGIDNNVILHWLPIEQRSIFKTALLVYKFLNCGQPRYFAPFLKPRQSVYNTRKSQADGVFLEIPHFATS